MAPVSEAQKRANEKYTKANYDEIKVRVPKGKKEIIKAHADYMKESATAFFNRAIDETMERDNTSSVATPERLQPTAVEPSKVKNDKKEPTPVRPFTPEARKAVDLKLLLADIRYQLDIQALYGMDALTNLLNEAKNIQEPDTLVGK